MGGTDIVEFHAFQFLEGILHGRTVLTDDIGIVAYHLQPERVTVDLLIDHTSVQGSETAKGITREKDVVTKGHHRLRPVDHRGQHEVQRVTSQLDGIAVFHLYRTIDNSIEALHHLESLLVADDLDVRIILLDQGNGAAMVWLHVVNHQVVDRTFPDHLMDMFDELGEKVHFNGVYQTDFLVINQIRVVTHAIGKGPQTLKQRLVTVVDTHIIDVVGNCLHSNIFLRFFHQG